MTSLQHMMQHLFQKDDVSEVTVETLEQFAADYPLFAPAQFLLAQKYKKTSDPAFDRQIQKTVLHFHNPLWLHYQLTRDQQNMQEPDFTRPAKIIETVTREEDLPGLSHDLVEDVVVHQEVSPEITVVDVPSVEESSVSSTGSDYRETVGAEQEIETVNEDIPLAISTPEVKSDIPITREEATNDKTEGGKKPGFHPLFGKLGEDENAENKITFEPFHTVDYFASQGIKISAEFKPDDRLGKQLKSFTEWLKTMRKLPEATVDAELGKINDTEIEQIAAHSLEGKEVVTEAMAEVLLKQGRTAQALDMYRKLSLLNPDKSTYFAAKIEALKH